MASRDTQVGKLCDELGVTRQTLYRFVSPKGELRDDAKRLLGIGSTADTPAPIKKQEEEEIA
ncbi:hypothetical protein ACVWY5_005214 [Bradyrhizobium sp. USDA 3256]